ncbi:hypothetical protein NYR72_01220 [Actinobacillus equuli subsp. haemolyticus]|nr:hypothetical protein [Actinobacillus equuli]MDG4947283.1 hypothetical protein [Actinobacillus equuli subsp. haemolyticus]
MSVFLQKPCCLAVCTGLLALAGCKPLEAPIEQVQRGSIGYTTGSNGN